MLGVKNHKVIIRGEYAKRLCELLDGKAPVNNSSDGKCVRRTGKNLKDGKVSYEVVWE